MPPMPASAPASKTPEVPSVRVATLNLWFDLETWPARLEVMASQLADDSPDVVCCQESVDYPDGGSMAADLAEALGRDWRVAVSAGVEDLGERGVSGNAILTRLDLGETPETVTLPGTDQAGVHRKMVVTRLATPGDTDLVVATTHMGWGGPFENTRLLQAVAIDDWFNTHIPLNRFGASDPPVVLAGDFNTGPEADSLRFLRGEAVADGKSAFWTDAWTLAGDGSAGVTQSGKNAWTQKMAQKMGMSSADAMNRRIDFILARGWVFGRPGLPSSARLVCDRPSPDGVYASDHFGISADIAVS